MSLVPQYRRAAALETAPGCRREAVPRDPRLWAAVCQIPGAEGRDSSFTSLGVPVCVGAVQHLLEQQRWEGDIRAEPGSSGDLIDGIDLRRLASKAPKRLRSRVHAVL